MDVPDMPGYKFHSCNHPGGNCSGGVGIFYKESLPLKIREDLSFNESIVCELIFGHKHIFFTGLYRNPQNKVNSNEFNRISLVLWISVQDREKNVPVAKNHFANNGLVKGKVFSDFKWKRFLIKNSNSTTTVAIWMVT